MKIVFQKDELLSNLIPVMGTVSNKNTITSLEGVLIETLEGNTVRFSTYDMNKGTRTTFEALEVIEGGSYIVNAQRLMQIVKVMSESEITLEVDEKLIIHITSGNSGFTMSAIAGSDFPGLPELSGERCFALTCDCLKNMIGKVMHSIAEFDTRPTLCGAYFIMKAGSMEVISCDSYSLSRCSVRSEIENVGRIQEEQSSFILPGHALNEIMKLLSDKKSKVEIYLTRKHAILRFDNVVFFTRLIEGQYFDYERVTPHNQPIVMEVSRERLISGLERALLVAEEKIQGSGKSYVKLSVKGDVLALTSTSTSGRVYDEMPCIHAGADLEIGFNCRYLINNVRAAASDELVIKFRSANEAMTIEAKEKKEDESFFYLLLPVRMSE